MSPSARTVTYFVTDPGHPPIFSHLSTASARDDPFGGIAACKVMVSAPMQGPEDRYAVGEAIAATIFAPILRTHRMGVEQMAPGLPEALCAPLPVAVKQAMDDVIAKGMPRKAARDVRRGHRTSSARW
ncbi:MAG: hypothetical protein ACI9ZH_000036 [Paracoccaceae bacterium]|jgi:hypothetical protein